MTSFVINMVNKDLEDAVKGFLTRAQQIRRYELTATFPLSLKDMGSEVLGGMVQQLEIQYGPVLRNTPEGLYLAALRDHYLPQQERPVPDHQVDKTLLDRPLGALEFSVRTHNSLAKVGVGYLGQLVQLSEKDVFKANKSDKRKVLREIKEILGELGLSLDMRVDNYWTAPQG